MRSERGIWKPLCSTTRSQPHLRITLLESTVLLPALTCPLTQIVLSHCIAKRLLPRDSSGRKSGSWGGREQLGVPHVSSD
ncbi:hypothetical protein ILYODFUR_007719 [Ilyodon furcidens]|nr:hypothetical protein [Characodon lateralis]